KKCLSDESVVILLEELCVDDKLHFVEEPVEVIDRKIKQLKMSRIPIIKKYLADSELHVPLEDIKVDDKLYFVEEPVEIVNRQVKKLKRIWILIVKVRWDSQRGSKFT
nr:putative reverse transcriptase domain-containing protein [Tanacetum cinerariifolium]